MQRLNSKWSEYATAVFAMIYAYKMTDDNGAAPCPQGGFLTLAICKPEIRKNAKLGDTLIGVGGKNLGLGRLIYAAKITEIIGPGSAYYTNPAHLTREDCIYQEAPDGTAKHRGRRWNHYCNNAKSFRPRDVARDWKNAYVLKSTDFRYLGANGPGDLLIDYHYLGGGGPGFPINYADLRSLIELSRLDFPERCLKIDSKRIEWPEIDKIIKHLWQRYSPTNHGKPTHPGTNPQPSKWRQHNKKVDAYRGRNRFNRLKFGFPP